MGNHNSLVVYTTLFERLLADIADRYVNSESRLDLKKFRSRLDCEGFSFLTKTLPRLGKAFDKALQGNTRFNPQGFEKKPGTTIPKFIGWLFDRVFTGLGEIRSDADIRAISDIRQITGLVYKLNLPYEERENSKVLDSFVAIEEELTQLVIDPTDAVVRKARRLVTSVLTGSCPRDIIPRHGAGAVATGEKVGRKPHFSRIYRGLEAKYPFTEYFMASMSHSADDPPHQRGDLEVLEHGTARVVLVPKDSRGPRLISCEPLELQWIQGGQQRKLYDCIESHWITKGQVNFTDQMVNRRLALSSSNDGEWVTLDMKDASDRVSLDLVEQLFSGTEWFQYLAASRSSETRLPDGRLVHMRKFAPMGSATCFPVEALTFYALAVSVIMLHHSVPFAQAIRQVYVYGDDIICRREHYAAVMQQLERFGLMFNRDKCCVSGFFRESCGCDAYKGIDVTPVRLRKTWSHHAVQDASQLVSYVAFHNAMYQKGYRRVATYVRHLVESLYGRLPYVDYTVEKDSLSKEYLISPGRVIGWYCHDVIPLRLNKLIHIRTRFNRETHVMQVKGYSVTKTPKRWRISGWEALLRYFGNGRTGVPAGTYTEPRSSRLIRGVWGSMG